MLKIESFSFLILSPVILSMPSEKKVKNEKIKALLQLMRPLEWSKTFGNMIFAAFLAVFVLGNFVFHLEFFNLPLFLLGFVSAGVLLWGGLYTLNDVMDYRRDKLHSVKSNRPIASGKISPGEGLFFSGILIALAFAIGVLLNNFLFLICLTAMLLTQLLYSVPPFEFKKRPVLDLIFGSAINPFFRFFSGWVLFIPEFNAPILMVVFVVGFQLSGFILYRLNSKELEKKENYHSSVVVFKADTLKFFSFLIGGIAGLSFLLMCLAGFFPVIKPFGFLPLKFVWFLVASAIAIPFYKPAAEEPEKMDIKKMHSFLYWHYLALIVIYILLFVLF